MNKFTALFLVFSLLLLSGELFSREKKGAHIIVHKKDGQILECELIAVQTTNLLLQNSKTSYMERINIDDVRTIVISMKPKFVLRIFVGSLVGGAIGCTLGFLEGDEPDYPQVVSLKGGGWEPGATAEKKALIYGLAGVFIGGATGASIGGLIGNEKQIEFEGASEIELKQALEYLRKKAKVPNYR